MEYYKSQYDIDIRDQHQPMLVSRAKKRAWEEQGVEKYWKEHRTN